MLIFEGFGGWHGRYNLSIKVSPSSASQTAHRRQHRKKSARCASRSLSASPSKNCQFATFVFPKQQTGKHQKHNEPDEPTFVFHVLCPIRQPFEESAQSHPSQVLNTLDKPKETKVRVQDLIPPMFVSKTHRAIPKGRLSSKLVFVAKRFAHNVRK